MSEGDINQIADIEGESFPTTWPRTAYRRELGNRIARYLVVVDREHTLVRRRVIRPPFLRLLRRQDDTAEVAEYIVGYVGTWLMVDEAHIVAIAVRESYRRRGLGELLLAEAVELAIANQQENVTLEVRRSNFAAQALYEKSRFLKVGVRKHYYSDNHEDAIIMTTPPIQDEFYAAHLAWLRQQHALRWASEIETGQVRQEPAAK